jgi:hypothetical protein
MKRLRESDEIISDSRIVFNRDILQILEKYLDDESLSALARCSKSTISICYFRLAKNLKWGKTVFIFGESSRMLSSNKFLHIQMAKIIISANEKAETSKSSKHFHYDWPFTLDAYLNDVCFATFDIILRRAEVVSNGEFFKKMHNNLQYSNRDEFLTSLEIVKQTLFAKCQYYVRIGDFNKYIFYRSKLDKKEWFFFQAIKACDNPAYDIRIIINDIKLHLDHPHIFSYISMALDYTSNFYCFEIPAMFYYFKQIGVEVCGYLWRLLVREEFGLERFNKLLEYGCFDHYEFLRFMRGTKNSILSKDLDCDDVNAIWNFFDFDERPLHFIVNEINKLSQIPLLKSYILRRLEKILPVFQEIVEEEAKYYWEWNSDEDNTIRKDKEEEDISDKINKESLIELDSLLENNKSDIAEESYETSDEE